MLPTIKTIWPLHCVHSIWLGLALAGLAWVSAATCCSTWAHAFFFKSFRGVDSKTILDILPQKCVNIMHDCTFHWGGCVWRFRIFVRGVQFFLPSQNTSHPPPYDCNCWWLPKCAKYGSKFPTQATEWWKLISLWTYNQNLSHSKYRTLQFWRVEKNLTWQTLQHWQWCRNIESNSSRIVCFHCHLCQAQATLCADL